MGGDISFLVRITLASVRLCFVSPGHLLNQWMDFDQTFIDTLRVDSSEPVDGFLSTFHRYIVGRVERVD